MSNLETYNRIFVETFTLSEEKLPDYHYQDTPEWDSVGHMTLITALEEAFEIMIDTDDIIEFSSWARGKEILKKYDIELLN